MLLLFLASSLKGRKHHYHPFPLKCRHLIYLTILLKVLCESQEKQLPLILKDDGATSKEYIGFHLIALLEESLCMTKLKLIVMVIGLRTKSHLLNDYLRLLGFLLLCFLALLI